MSITLIEALKGLSAENDDHWTQEGLPRLDVLKELVGGNVTRGEIPKSFNRYNPVIEEETGSQLNKDDEKVENKDVPHGTEDLNSKDSETDADNVDEFDELELSEDELIEACYIQAGENLRKAQAAFKVAQLEMDKVRIKREEERKAVPAHVMIKRFQVSQAEQRANQVTKAQDIAKVINAMNANPSAKIEDILAKNSDNSML